MADDSIMPLLLLGAAGYFLWQYYQTAAPVTSTPAATPAASWDDPETSLNTAAVTPQLQTTPAQYTPPPSTYTPPSYTPPASQQPAAAASASVYRNPYWQAGGTPATTPPPAQAAAATPAPNMCFGQCCTCQGSGCSAIPGCTPNDVQAGSFASAPVANTIYCGPGCYIYYGADGSVVGTVGTSGTIPQSFAAAVAQGLIVAN